MTAHLPTRIRLLSWLLLSSAALLLAACDRTTSTQGEISVPSTTPPSTAQSRIEAPAANQDLEKVPSIERTEPPDLGVSVPQQEPQTDPGELAVPPAGSPLSPEEAHRLLSGKVVFNPGSIASSNIAIAPHTPLHVGDDLQVKWGNSWWAATVLGFEPDGRIRIHYFGWSDSWDEPKTRAELQADNTARVRALDTTYVRKNW